MIYLLLSIAFVLSALMVAALAIVLRGGWRRARRWVAPVLLAAAVLVALTAFFDNVLIALGVMVYSDDVILGIRIGEAPIEDFAYPLAALLLLPALWALFGTEPRDD